jgi:hypothetical protein
MKNVEWAGWLKVAILYGKDGKSISMHMVPEC